MRWCSAIEFIVMAVAAVLALCAASFRVLREYERAVVFRLGRVQKVRGPGVVLLIPLVERMVKMSLRTVVLDVPKQDVITKDNVSIIVNAVVYLKVVDPVKATIEVEDFNFATSQLAQTTLRSVVGQADLDQLLSERDEINTKLRSILDKHTDPWGVKVSDVEVKHIDLPPTMQRAMARQAEAERDRRAKIIMAEGECQASAKLAEASTVLERSPVSLQLRYLQTLSEIATEQNSTIVFPIPIDLFKPFMDKVAKTED